MEKIVALVIGILVGSSFLYYLLKPKRTVFENDVEVDELKLETVINWFKNEENRRYLLEDQDNKAVLLKAGEKLEKILNKDLSSYSDNYVLQCIFNTKNEKIIRGRLIKFKTIEKELEKMFGEKSMLIFQ